MNMATSQEVSLVKKYETVKEWFSKEEVRNQLATLVPAHINPDKLLRVAFQVIKENNDLLRCSVRSLVAVILGGLQLGLSFEKALGQAYPVPFGPEAVLIIGYRGYINLARNSGEVTKVSAHPVYEKDFFEVEYGTNERLVHKPVDGDRGGFKGAYCVFFYKDGGTSFEFMTKEKVDAIKARAKSKTGPWTTDYEEMGVKSVIRHHAKYVPLSTERLAKAAALEDRVFAGESQLDLLPELENVTPKEDTTALVTNFDTLLSSWINENIKDMTAGEIQKVVSEFLEFVAKQNSVTIDAVKADASKRFPQFAESLAKRLSSLKPKEKKGKEELKKPLSPSITPTPTNLNSPTLTSNQPTMFSEAKKSTISCPAADAIIDITNCDKCPDKEGCPAIE
jgi:recombination protein RecT